MIIGNPVFDLVSRIMYSITDCNKCHKAKRSFIVWLLMMFTALVHGAVAGMIFLIVGDYVGIEQYRMELMLRLPMIGGTAAYLWYMYWQFDKFFCECE
jgi:hypothetical protein